MSELPDGITEADRNAASEGDRFTDEHGTTWVTLVSKRDGSKKLVHEDVVQYEQLDHPFVTGLAGFGTLLATFVATIAAAWLYLATYGPLVNAAIGLGSLGAATLLARGLLAFTPVGTEVYRFLEWYEHRELIVGRDIEC